MNERSSPVTATAADIIRQARHIYETHGGDGAWIAMESAYLTLIAKALQPATPTAGWTEGDVALFAARMRGIGLMKPQAYGQIEHDLVRKLLQEFPRFAPATGGDAVAGEAKALADLISAVKRCDSYANPESALQAKMAAYEATRAPGEAATAPETLREQRRAERKERTGLDVEEALTLEDERPKWPAKGCWMRFLGKNGYEFQLKEARNRFEVGKEYLVEECNVQSWSHSIKFDAMEGWYNGVMFEMCRPPSGDVAQPSTDEDHPDCSTKREHELYFALMGLAGAVMSRRKEWENWEQGGIKVAPVVRKALRLAGCAISSTNCEGGS
jgi:hypothetical protein